MQYQRASRVSSTSTGTYPVKEIASTKSVKGNRRKHGASSSGLRIILSASVSLLFLVFRTQRILPLKSVSIGGIRGLSQLSSLDGEMSEMEEPAELDQNAVLLADAMTGREPLLELLKETGITDLDLETIQRLPTWDGVRRLYGNGPILYGNETCQTFRDTIPSSGAYPAVAGLQNTGTNLLAMYLGSNCFMPHNKDRGDGKFWQVPWGKHRFANEKWSNTANNRRKANKTNTLPVVLIKDPYNWMKSMCSNSYNVFWSHTPLHCPNLVPDERDTVNGDAIPVRVHLTETHRSYHDSLAHLWSDWYRQYYQVSDYPRVMIRYEDLVFYPKQVSEAVCECAGGVPRQDNFSYIVESAKWGKGHERFRGASLLSSMIKYGDAERRLKEFSEDDLKLAHEGLDEDLMRIFQYNRPLESISVATAIE